MPTDEAQGGGLSGIERIVSCCFFHVQGAGHPSSCVTEPVCEKRVLSFRILPCLPVATELRPQGPWAEVMATDFRPHSPWAETMALPTKHASACDSNSVTKRATLSHSFIHLTLNSVTKTFHVSLHGHPHVDIHHASLHGHLCVDIPQVSLRVHPPARTLQRWLLCSSSCPFSHPHPQAFKNLLLS